MKLATGCQRAWQVKTILRLKDKKNYQTEK